LALVALSGPHERLDEAVPDRGAAIDGEVRGHAELGGTRLDRRAFGRVHAAGVGEHGMHVPAALLQVGHAERGVQAAAEGEHDVAGRAGNVEWGMGNGRISTHRSFSWNGKTGSVRLQGQLIPLIPYSPHSR